MSLVNQIVGEGAEDSPVRALFSKIESLLLMLYEIAYGEDIKTFLSAILYVAIVDTVGSYINLLTILYICLVCAMTIPVLYLQFQEVIDNFIREVSEEKNKLLEVLKSNVLNKIPRATKEE
uniref:Reticulon-like protein n=1 Tax=Brassica campestris TaxID=3711 RepID=M4DCW8_BRACM